MYVELVCYGFCSSFSCVFLNSDNANDAMGHSQSSVPLDKAATLAVMFGGGPGCGKSRELQELPIGAHA